jgi:hypothetical protein
LQITGGKILTVEGGGEDKIKDKVVIGLKPGKICKVFGW